MIQSNVYFEIFFKKLDNANQRMESYLDNPSEENIHHMRTSIRRLESAYYVLPKSSKTKSSDKIIKQFKNFFSFNNKVRDYDIILDKLTGYGYDSESKLVLILQKKKLTRLSKAILLAEKISDAKKPKIKKSKKPSSKFEKKTLSLISDFKKFIPIVVEDESNVKELHSMRKIIKKLRYVLELEPNNSYQNIIPNLKHLQNFLGDIHDCDIFIWYFQKIKNSEDNVTNMLNLEKTKRNKIYKTLVSSLSSFETISA